MEVRPTAACGPKTSRKAVASLILGVLSFALVCFTAIPGLILAVWGLADINRRPAELKGGGVAIAGFVTSSLGLLVVIPTVLMVFVLPAAEAKRERERSQNKLKQIGMAMRHYHDALGQSPTRAPSRSNSN